jgi:hypothetical protein
MKEKVELQAALQGLHDEGYHQSTPTKSAHKVRAGGEATTTHLQQLACHQEALDVLVGLQVRVIVCD